MKTTTLEYDEDNDMVWIKAPYDKDFNTGLAAKPEIEIEDFCRETARWAVYVDPDHYDMLEQLILSTIGGQVVWI